MVKLSYVQKPIKNFITSTLFPCITFTRKYKSIIVRNENQIAKITNVPSDSIQIIVSSELHHFSFLNYFVLPSYSH